MAADTLELQASMLAVDACSHARDPLFSSKARTIVDLILVCGSMFACIALVVDWLCVVCSVAISHPDVPGRFGVSE